MSNTNQLSGAANTLPEFDCLALPSRPRLELRRATRSDLSRVFRFATNALPEGIAGEAAVARVIAHNRNSVLLFTRNGTVVGFWAMLMLTPLGLEGLLLNEFDPLAPDPDCLAETLERPAAIYNWAVVAPKLAAEGVYHVSRFLRKPLYRNANLYSRPNTEAGVQFNLRLGARPIPGTSGLFRYVRRANRRPALAQAA